VIGYFLPDKPPEKSKRKLGLLEGKAKVVFHTNFKITEEDFLSL